METNRALILSMQEIVQQAIESVASDEVIQACIDMTIAQWNGILENLEGRVEANCQKMEEYVSLACDFLERISPDIVIQRLVGDTHGDFLISPVWNATKGEVFAAITNELKHRNSYQGAKC